MRTPSSFAVAQLALIALIALIATATVGCGGSGESQPPPATAAQLQVDAGARSGALLPPPSDVTMPPVRPVPPLALGSKVARVRGKTERTLADAIGDAPQPACVSAAPIARAGAPDATTVALAKACAPAMKPVGSPHTVSMSERDPAVVIPLVASRGCYRVFAASPPGVEGFVVVIVDSKGAIATEARTNGRAIAVPAEGPLCFDADDAAKIVTSAARGSGTGSVLLVRE